MRRATHSDQSPARNGTAAVIHLLANSDEEPIRDHENGPPGDGTNGKRAVPVLAVGHCTQYRAALGALRDGNPAQRLRRVRAVRVHLPDGSPTLLVLETDPARFLLRSAALLPKG